MMHETRISNTGISLDSFLGVEPALVKHWEKSEVKVISLPEVADIQIADSHLSSWRKYCDGRLRQFVRRVN